MQRTSRRNLAVAVCLATVLLFTLSAAGNEPAEPPTNLAQTARVTASDEYNGDYLATFAVDGKVPGLLSGEDRRAAWVVNGGRTMAVDCRPNNTRASFMRLCMSRKGGA